MSQFERLSPQFREFGIPVLEELLKKQKAEDKKPEDVEVVEITEPKEEVSVEIKDET